MSDMSAIRAEAPAWLTAPEVASAFGVHAVTIYRLFHAGDLPGHRTASAIRIPAGFVNDALALIGAGQQLDIAEFGRHWSAREAATA